jgi:hypothetical protein
MIAIVCGGRDYRDVETLYAKLDEIAPTFVIQGGARGADRLARTWALERCIPCATVDAYWDTFGKLAGPVRNGWMLRLNPDAVIAFPGGSGTAGMVKLARQAGVTVIEVG